MGSRNAEKEEVNSIEKGITKKTFGIALLPGKKDKGGGLSKYGRKYGISGVEHRKAVEFVASELPFHPKEE